METCAAQPWAAAIFGVVALIVIGWIFVTALKQ